MKNRLVILLGLFATCASAQVAIGKTSVSSPSVSLEFYDGADNTRAIILPWVKSADEVSSATNGTLIFDSNDKIVKFKTASGWSSLSRENRGAVDVSLQSNLTEKAEAKTMIGGNPSTDTTPGILVLGDTNKAMVLPKVAKPHLTIVNPEPGTLVFDTESKQLAVFNGLEWSFWRP